MAARSRRRSVRREVLEHASPALLARWLEPFTSFFAAHGIDLAPLRAGTAEATGAVAEHVFQVMHDPGRTPAPKAELIVALETLDALATPDGAAELFRLDRDGVLPRGTLGDADLALTALLDHPELAAMASATSSRDPDHKFVEYAATAALTFDDAALGRFRDTMADRLHAIDHTSFCRIHVLDDRARLDLEIVHGSRPKTRDVVRSASSLSRVTDVTARRSFVRLDRPTGRLAVRAPFPAIRECIRASIGDAVAGDAKFFHGGGLYDLGPFRDLERALSAEGVSGLAGVELRAIKIALPDGFGAAYARPRQDALGSKAGKKLVALALEVGSCVSALVYLRRKNEAPVRLELAADGKNNVVKYDRDDPDAAAVVEAWLRERGILRAIDGAAARDAAPPAVVGGE